MTQYQSGLADTLLNNFVTIRYPRSLPDLEWRDSRDKDRMEYALAAEHLALRFEKMSLRMGLGDSGFFRFFEFQESDPTNFYLHLFIADADAIPLIASLVEGIVETGNPQYFDPKAFVVERLHHIENSGCLARKYPWWFAEESP